MRKITKEICEAFLRKEKKAIGNTATDGKALFLHGNRIAERVAGNTIKISLAGWPTVTTRERLNGLLELMRSPFRVRQRNFKQMLGKYDKSKETIYFRSMITDGWYYLVDRNEDVFHVRPS